jgi:hypothetical protein
VARQSTFRIDRVGVALGSACAWLTIACNPELVVGKWKTEEEACSLPNTGAAGAPAQIIEVPWTTGFEDDFCDYLRSGGLCYGGPDSAHSTVPEPVHSGQRAAAFTITSDPAKDGVQTRCFLQGPLPADAVYGAWFLIPELATSTGNWNLVHFAGGMQGPLLPGTWDISLENGADGSLHLYVRDFLNGLGVQTPDPAPPVPIGNWFHVEFRILRATDATGHGRAVPRRRAHLGAHRGHHGPDGLRAVVRRQPDG